MVYALADVHGNKENFDTVLEKINLQLEDTLYILGDVVDRNPYGIQLLQQIMKMPNAHMLLGNHEWMMMEALDINYTGFTDSSSVIENTRESKWEQLRLWYSNGGDITYDAWKDLSATDQEELKAYLSCLPLGYDIIVDGRKFKLVHAAPAERYRRFLMSKWANAVEFAVWDRKFYRHRLNAGYTLIFGHTPTSYMQDNDPLEIWDAGDRVGIDCGSCFPEGRLACLRLDDMRVFYSK